MKNIQMVDLVTQYEKIKPAIDEAILSVIQNAQFINGPEVQNFQKELEKVNKTKYKFLQFYSYSNKIKIFNKKLIAIKI